MGFNVTPEQIQAFEAARKAKTAEAQRKYEQLEQQRKDFQAAVKAKVEAARLSQIHTAQEDYVCDHCGKTIPEGTRYRRQRIVTGYGFPEGNHYDTRITHLVCCVTKCTFFEECGVSTSGLCNNEFGHQSFRECGVYKKKSEASA
jgi:hypothetical protein